MAERTIERNLVLQSPVTGRYYFVPKCENLGGAMRVIGRKVDVTKSIEALFGKLLRAESRKARKSKRSGRDG